MSAAADALVLFGATGDLARKKLYPALARLAGRGALDVPVVGVARSDWDDERLRAYARDAVAAAGPVDEAAFARLARRLTLVSGDYADPATFTELARRLGGAGCPAHYLAIPPSAFPVVVRGLEAAGLVDGARVVVEKPFGRDLASARELGAVLLATFPESSILRIDHYLQKEAVEDLLVFRFANTFLEPIWNRAHVASIQVTMAESFGVEGRGSFYDGVGAIRDVVQNHLLQVVALLAMEPPVSDDADALRDERVKVLTAMRPVAADALVRGQYAGYTDEAGVAPGSTVETFAALRLDIDSWRWAGVPFFVRAGKALAATALEALVELKPPPRLLFASPDAPPPHANLLRFRLGHDDGVTLSVQAKEPGGRLASRPVDLRVDFATALGPREEAYERLLADALAGEPRRFARQDTVEQAWRVIEPALTEPGPVHRYARGSWGPVEADAILAGSHWHVPEHGGGARTQR